MDNNRVLLIIRGLPGSGKSFIANKLHADKTSNWFEADFYFSKDGDYRFDSTNLDIAHRECYDGVERAMRNGVKRIIMSNTSITRKEYMKYIHLAQSYSYAVQVCDVYGDFGSVHRVPEKTMGRMRKRWVPFNPHDLP